MKLVPVLTISLGLLASAGAAPSQPPANFHPIPTHRSRIRVQADDPKELLTLLQACFPMPMELIPPDSIVVRGTLQELEELEKEGIGLSPLSPSQGLAVSEHYYLTLQIWSVSAKKLSLLAALAEKLDPVLVEECLYTPEVGDIDLLPQHRPTLLPEVARSSPMQILQTSWEEGRRCLTPGSPNARLISSWTTRIDVACWQEQLGKCAHRQCFDPVSHTFQETASFSGLTLRTKGAWTTQYEFDLQLSLPRPRVSDHYPCAAIRQTVTSTIGKPDQALVILNFISPREFREIQQLGKTDLCQSKWNDDVSIPENHRLILFIYGFPGYR